MGILTRHGRTLAHQVCSWLCHEDIHALTTVGPADATPADVWAHAEAMGLTVVEVLPAREVDVQAFLAASDAATFDALGRLSPPDQRPGLAWAVRVRVEGEV